MCDNLRLVKQGIMNEEDITLTPDQCLKIMKTIEEKYGNGKDEEEFHLCADELMEMILIKHGYMPIVQIFERNAKWYC